MDFARRKTVVDVSPLSVCLVQEVQVELRVASLDSSSDPNVVFCYGDEISRLKYLKYSRFAICVMLLLLPIMACLFNIPPFLPPSPPVYEQIVIELNRFYFILHGFIEKHSLEEEELVMNTLKTANCLFSPIEFCYGDVMFKHSELRKYNVCFNVC